MATIVLPLVVVNWTAQRQMLLTWGEEGAASLSVEEGEGGVSGSELGRRWGGGPGGHRVGTGPREQLSRQFYSTPIFTLPSVNNVCMITCELWVTI